LKVIKAIIIIYTNSYADPNQDYNTNLNSHIHSFVLPVWFYVNNIIITWPQGQFCTHQPKEIQNRFFNDYKNQNQM